MTDGDMDLLALLDKYDRVVAAAAAILPPEAIEPTATIGRSVRRRRALVERVTVVGLLGGTGSGKSSLLNALAGNEISAAGARRPTTARPLAWIPANAGPALAALLEMLGIEERVEHHEPAPLALLDLPDIDSLVSEHRRLVSEIIPYLDVAIWVVDPEKYHDHTLHDLVRSLRAHEAIFRFVLNQIDRLDPADLILVSTDLQRALRANGVRNPVVWVAAADPTFGPPQGIEEILEELLAARTSTGERNREMLKELERGVALLGPYVESVDFTSRWEDVLMRMSALLREGRRSEAENELRVLAAEILPGADIEVAEPVAAAWDQPDLGGALDASVGRQIREQLRPRAQVRALIAELQLAINEVRA